MQCMIWFAGLRGAIAFALSQNMPGPNKGVYETTTLGVVFFTTVVCGGLTEKVLTRTGMKRSQDTTYGAIPGDDQPLLAGGAQSLGPRKKEPKLGVHGWWVRVDAKVMKPLFGGRPRDSDEPAGLFDSH